MRPIRRCMKRLLLCLGVLVGLLFPGASWESKAHAADGIRSCAPNVTNIGFVPAGSPTPTAVAFTFTFACPTSVTHLHFGYSNCGSLMTSVQGEIVIPYSAVVNPDGSTCNWIFTHQPNGGYESVTIVLPCKDNLVAHRQAIDWYGFNWYDEAEAIGSDGPWGYNNPTVHAGPAYVARCGLL